MQSVSSGAVASYARKYNYVRVEYNGTSVTVTNNLGRSDLRIEIICLGSGETFSYVLRQSLSSSSTPQSITSYNGRVPSSYDSMFVTIMDNNGFVIGSGIIGNLGGSNTGGILVYC